MQDICESTCIKFCAAREFGEAIFEEEVSQRGLALNKEF